MRMTQTSCTVAGCTCNLADINNTSDCLCPPYGHYQNCRMINEDYSRGWEEGYNAHTRYWVCCYETHEYEQQCTRRVPYGHGYTCDLCPWGRDKVRTVNEYAQHLRREHCAQPAPDALPERGDHPFDWWAGFDAAERECIRKHTPDALRAALEKR